MKRTFLPATFLCLILLLSSFSVFSCQQETPLENDKKKEALKKVSITEVTHSILFIPLYTACEKGFFQENGLDVKIITLWDNTQALEHLNTGQTNFLLAGTENIFYQLQKENKTKLSAMAQICNSTGYFLVRKKNTNTFSWNELKRKVIVGLNHGDLSQMVLDQSLTAHNIIPLQDVHIVQNIPLGKNTTAFLGGVGNYVLLREPEASKLESLDAGIIIIDFSSEYQNLVANVLISSDEYLKANRTTSLSLINALHQSLQWINNSPPEDILEIAIKYFPNEDEKVLLRSICRYKNLGCWPYTPCINTSGLKKAQDIMISEKELNNNIPISKVMNNMAHDVVVDTANQ